ncbi:MAG: polyprenol monophosphomannose synthase [Patescibacteria group bacterium]
MFRTIVLIPTYNERDNVRTLIPALLRDLPGVHVCVIDDSSPDGTAEVAHELALSANGRLQVVVRKHKEGLGRAYADTLRSDVVADFDAIIMMDADWSHDYYEIPKFLSLLENCDIVVGSRYVVGGRVENWVWRRRLLSWGGNTYARLILGIPVRDCTAGFTCLRRSVVEAFDPRMMSARGYGFTIQFKYTAFKKGFRIIESPIVFSERREGASKMSFNIITEALFLPWKLRFDRSLKAR